MDSMNMDSKTNQNCYDPPYRNMNYSNVDAMQSYQQSNQMSMSRLNPRASVFSSMGASKFSHFFYIHIELNIFLLSKSESNLFREFVCHFQIFIFASLEISYRNECGE